MNLYTVLKVVPVQVYYLEMVEYKCTEVYYLEAVELSLRYYESSSYLPNTTLILTLLHSGSDTPGHTQLRTAILNAYRAANQRIGRARALENDWNV